MRFRFEEAQRLLEEAVFRVYSGAVALVGFEGEVVWERAVGATADPRIWERSEPVTNDTVFDLASLTKPLVTAALWAILVSRGKARFEDPLGEILEEAKGTFWGEVPIGRFLAHSSGLAAYRPFASIFFEARGIEEVGSDEARKFVLRSIVSETAQYRTGEQSIYSDLGYILLGMAIEAICSRPLDEVFDDLVARPLGLQRTFFVRGCGGSVRTRYSFGATDFCPLRRRLLQGEVHDQNAFLLGGVAGHAGLFGTAREVFKVIRAFCGLEANGPFERATVERLLSREFSAPGSEWLMGFDTPTPPSSSAGSLYPKGLVGHLGFTGTSFWFEPKSASAVILLTNRVHQSRDMGLIKTFRPRFHDAVWRVLYGKS